MHQPQIKEYIGIKNQHNEEIVLWDITQYINRPKRIWIWMNWYKYHGFDEEALKHTRDALLFHKVLKPISMA